MLMQRRDMSPPPVQSRLLVTHLRATLHDTVSALTVTGGKHRPASGGPCDRREAPGGGDASTALRVQNLPPDTHSFLPELLGMVLNQRRLCQHRHANMSRCGVLTQQLGS